MSFFVWIIIMFVVFAGFFVAAAILSSDEEDTKAIKKILRIVGVVVLVAGIPVVTLLSSMNEVPAGSVGIVYKFGAIDGQTDSGLQFILPWQSLVSASTQVQSRKYEKLDSFSKQTQNVFVSATVNFHVSPENIQKLYRTVGANYVEVLIDPRVYQDFKDATVLYSSVDIAPNRDNIRNVVRKRITDELKAQSIIVDDVLIQNISFSKEFESSIENKQIQSQNALASAEQVKVKRQEAQQAIETAKGQAESSLIKAQKEAQANDILAKSLSPELIKYITVQKLAPNVKVLMIPPSNQFILGSDMMNSKTGN